MHKKNWLFAVSLCFCIKTAVFVQVWFSLLLRFLEMFSDGQNMPFH